MHGEREDNRGFMISWLQQLDRATTLEEVVVISRDYLSTWTPKELARLPRGCRPGRLREPEDIEELHSCSVDAYRSTRASGDELTALQLLTSFIVRASQRIASLRAEQTVDPAVTETSPESKRQGLRSR